VIRPRWAIAVVAALVVVIAGVATMPSWEIFADLGG
jgi:hypothetical protein